MCNDCYYGARMIRFRGSAYVFKEITKVVNKEIKNINYSNKEFGCRMTQWNEKEKLCLSSNFSQFKPLII